MEVKIVKRFIRDRKRCWWAIAWNFWTPFRLASIVGYRNSVDSDGRRNQEIDFQGKTFQFYVWSALLLCKHFREFSGDYSNKVPREHGGGHFYIEWHNLDWLRRILLCLQRVDKSVANPRLTRLSYRNLTSFIVSLDWKNYWFLINDKGHLTSRITWRVGTDDHWSFHIYDISGNSDCVCEVLRKDYLSTNL